MPTFKIATWNVNSLRVRLPHVLAWLETNQPDVLALQETKLVDNDFPIETFLNAGYKAIFSGQKTYNGVAILSKEDAGNIVTDFPSLIDDQRRVLCATINNIRILNLYVPNGESVSSSKYQYKLDWLNALDRFVQQESEHYNHMVMLGDFNIAPDEADVHDPKQWEGQVLCTGAEREAFQKLKQIGFEDCFRFANPSEKQYSWWDYRLNAFKRNLGLRIDHILASKSLLNVSNRCLIDPIPRGWERPSDHTPVIAEFNI